MEMQFGISTRVVQRSMY